MPSICRTNLSWLPHSLTLFWRDIYDEEIYWKYAIHSLPLVASCDEHVKWLLGYFRNSNTHKFTWFGNLPTPRSYWFVLIKLRNNTNNKTRRRRETSLLNSSSLSHVFLSVFSLFTAFFTHRHNSSSLSIHLCPPFASTCANWRLGIPTKHIVEVGHCLSPNS